MPALKRIICTVTNDLVYDQRMIRICTTLARAGYHVTLVGRQYRDSPSLTRQIFAQHRLRPFFRKGILFYAEYNIRLFIYLLQQKVHLLCAIDLDTILPVWAASNLKNSIRVYDAHELFCEMKEVKSRPLVYRIWKGIERKAVPYFRLGYTVNKPIKDIFLKEYGVQYAVVRNVPVLRESNDTETTKPYILYQGAVNEGRCFETLIPAFRWVALPLHIYGDGNFLEKAKALVRQYGLEHKVLFKGKLAPEALRPVTAAATLGITLFEDKGLSNYYSLANRFFDYMHAGVPQLCVDYPVYREINNRHEVALLIRELSSESIAAHINSLLEDGVRLQKLRTNCRTARNVYNWQEEEKVLLYFYKNIFE